MDPCLAAKPFIQTVLHLVVMKDLTPSDLPNGRVYQLENGVDLQQLVKVRC
jgi:hypothetical protein